MTSAYEGAMKTLVEAMDEKDDLKKLLDDALSKADEDEKKWIEREQELLE